MARHLALFHALRSADCLFGVARLISRRRGEDWREHQVLPRKLEIAGALVEDGGAGQVRRRRSGVNCARLKTPVEREASASQHIFHDAGDILDQQVPVDEDRRGNAAPTSDFPRITVSTASATSRAASITPPHSLGRSLDVRQTTIRFKPAPEGSDQAAPSLIAAETRRPLGDASRYATAPAHLPGALVSERDYRDNAVRVVIQQAEGTCQILERGKRAP